MINFNGRTFTEEEFEEMRAQLQRQKMQEYINFSNQVKCGYAFILDTGLVNCGLDRERIDYRVDCPCASYKEKVFEIIE